MEEDHFSKEWDDAPMPHSIFFTPDGHAIHGSFETKRLGSAASHGCVRLAPANAAKLFALVKAQGVTNTKVVITGTQPDAAPAVARQRSAPQPNEPLPVAPGYYGQQVTPSYGPSASPAYGQQVGPGYARRSPGYDQPEQPVFVQPRYWNEYR
jgi:hypothetical protein